MPCSDNRDVLVDRECLDTLTRLLCCACQRLEDADYFIGAMPPELRAWWEEHKHLDILHGQRDTVRTWAEGLFTVAPDDHVTLLMNEINDMAHDQGWGRDECRRYFLEKTYIHDGQRYLRQA